MKPVYVLACIIAIGIRSESASAKPPPPERDASEEHWAFAPLRPTQAPTIGGGWAENGIDAFVERRLQEAGLQPSPEANRYTLIRRLFLDLTGLPPSPDEADAFVIDESPDAYEKMVDQLLASPAFGERMTWNWLQLARYADSNGYQGDRERTMWPWRDWVVEAINANSSYEEFTRWQLAGDLLPDATFEQRLATGFLRNHPINGEGGRIPEENRVDYVMDMTETVGTVWLGLTLNCARCHDHKFDPLTRRDYYALFDFFNQTPVNGGGGDPQTPPAIEAPSLDQRLELERMKRALGKAEMSLEQAERAAGVQSDDPGLPKEIREVLKLSVEARNPKQLETLAKHFEKQSEYAERTKTLREMKQELDRHRRSFARVMVMQDRSKRRTSYLLDKGLYDKRGDEVSPDVPSELPDLDADAPRNRLGLAKWLVDRSNPLTARVTVNRQWQIFFGKGLVKTAEDFGTQGDLPSHPELLDWLAVSFRDSGWDVKQLCRLIVCSATYKQSSRITPELYEIDPENRLLGRGARFRMASWQLRDQALQASGLLVRSMGGPPVYPYQPAGVWADATFGKKKYQRDSGAKLYRRSLYTFWRRIVGPTMFFDSPSRLVCSVKPTRTNTPLHALTTLNDVTYFEAGRHLATRVIMRKPHASRETLVRAAFRQVLVRPPRAEELVVLVSRLSQLEDRFAKDPKTVAEITSVGDFPEPTEHRTRIAALTAITNSILNLDETLTKE